MAIKPKWMIEEELGGSDNYKRGNRTENYYMLKLLLKITEQNKKNSRPASDYSIKNIGTDGTRPKYLSRMKSLGWIEWINGPVENSKTTGWIPSKKGRDVLKSIVKLQTTNPPNPILDLEAFQELGYIDKGLLEN